MVYKLFIFRHAETFDNSHGIFSGWRDSRLTQKGLSQAQKIAQQLKRYQIDYAFCSHLKRSKKTLEIVLQGHHPLVPIFIDDRLIERCYGLLQGENKRKLEKENPDWYDKIHRGYSLAPPEGESLATVDKRVTSFLEQLKEWLKQNPCNVAISCHSNSIRPFRKVFENLNIAQMCKLESPQDCATIYEIKQDEPVVKRSRGNLVKPCWVGVVLSRKVKLATDPLNLLNVYHF